MLAIPCGPNGSSVLSRSDADDIDSRSGWVLSRSAAKDHADVANVNAPMALRVRSEAADRACLSGLWSKDMAAYAHTIHLSLVEVYSERILIAAEAIAFLQGETVNSHCAIAHAEVLNSIAQYWDIFGSAAAAIASRRGWVAHASKASAQAVLTRPCN